MDKPPYVRPNPVQLPDHLQAWERYLDSDDADFLMQTAVVVLIESET